MFPNVPESSCKSYVTLNCLCWIKNRSYNKFINLEQLKGCNHDAILRSKFSNSWNEGWGEDGGEGCINANVFKLHCVRMI